MEHIAESVFYAHHVAPLYWWSIGLFWCGIAALAACGVKGALIAFGKDRKESK